MSYRTILIDDEPLAIQRLERLLQPHKDIVDIIASATSGRDAVALIKDLNPDLIFIDIQMPELTGFEVLRQLSNPPLVIFATAYDEFALKAFETNAIDYLVKPIDPKRLSAALEKLCRLTSPQRQDIRRQLQDLLRSVARTETQRLKVRVGNKIILVDVDTVVFFRAADKYVEAHTSDITHLITESLNQLQEMLAGRDFVRIHRSTMINLKFVRDIIRVNDAYQVRMNDRERSILQVSRSMKRNLGLGTGTPS